MIQLLTIQFCNTEYFSQELQSEALWFPDLGLASSPAFFTPRDSLVINEGGKHGGVLGKWGYIMGRPSSAGSIPQKCGNWN